MTKEAERISEETLADLIALTEHERIPTKLELDRFIRGQGYRLPPKLELIGDAEIKEAYDKGYEAKKVGKFSPPCLSREITLKEQGGHKAVAQAQLAADQKAWESGKSPQESGE